MARAVFESLRLYVGSDDGIAFVFQMSRIHAVAAAVGIPIRAKGRDVAGARSARSAAADRAGRAVSRSLARRNNSRRGRSDRTAIGVSVREPKVTRAAVTAPSLTSSRTAAAAAVTWNSDKWYGFPQKPFDVDFITRNDLAAAADMIDDDVAAVIVEPVQGVAGAFDLSGDFLRTLRTETHRHGALLISDEVQSGMGRTGSFFACSGYNVEPDILTAAKSLAGGLPAGAVLVADELAQHFGPGSLGTTFGGGPLAAAATSTVIDVSRVPLHLRQWQSS